MPDSINTHRLREFVNAMAAVLEDKPAEATILREGRELLRELVAHDDWLPDAYAQARPERYQQYLLHADSAERFSIVSFVWGPGQITPIHNHTVWGLIGMLRGAEYSQPYKLVPNSGMQTDGAPHQLLPGMVEAVSPTIGDIHAVRNALDDAVSISIHVYGANIGAVQRLAYTPDGSSKMFISGYSNTTLPNIWDRSLSVKNS